MSFSALRNCLQANLQQVHARMAAAVLRAGRSPADVRLIAVTKYAPWPAVVGLMELGHRDFGENRPQQLVERAAMTPAALRPTGSPLAGFPRDVNWHLIGQLQRNKVRGVLGHCALIHSVDSWRLLSRIDELARELQLRPQVLLQVNISGEESKSGFSPADFQKVLTQAEHLQSVQIQGLMTMAPLTEDADQVRQVFRALRQLRDASATETVPLAELSMGMSGDFEVAIEEGATLVRVGSALFAGIDSTDLGAGAEC
jgi:pyridoxal phosphate enzyme (YggS family)